MLKSMRKNGVTLALFALACTAVVVLTNELTQGRIAHQQQLEKLRTLSALLPEESYDNDLVASCKLVQSRRYLGSDQAMPLYTATKQGEITGYALETVAPDGYSGAIRLIVGTDAKGAVSAVRVLAHKETPGLGDKIELKKSDWINSFVGKFLSHDNEASWAVKKDGGEFDAFTGATITPRAVVKAVKNLLLLQQEHPELLRDAPACDATPNAGAQAMEQVDVIDGQSPLSESNGRREELKELMLQGLWKNNPSLVQVLGLCPTLAVSSTFTNALGLGLATMAVLVSSNLAISLVRNLVPKDIRIPVYVMIIAALVTSVQLLMNAYTYGLYQALGIFIALIVTNCVIIGRAEAYASKNPPLLAALDGFMMGLGFTLVLLVLGGLREIIGMGTLFDGADLLLGEWAKSLRIELFHADASLLLAILPPGGFIGLGLMIAGKNAINDWMGRKQSAEKAHCSVPAAGARATQL